MVCSCVFGLGRDFRKPVVSIQTQAVKFHKNFVHFKYSLRVNKKNILGEYLRSLSQVPGTIYTSNEQTVYRNNFVSKRPVTGTKGSVCLSTFGEFENK